MRIEAPWRKFTKRRYTEAQELLNALPGFPGVDLDALAITTNALMAASQEARPDRPWWKKLLNGNKERLSLEEERQVLTNYPSMPSATNWVIYHPSVLKSGEFWQPVEGESGLLEAEHSLTLERENTRIFVSSYTDTHKRRRILFDICKTIKVGNSRKRFDQTIETRLTATEPHGGIDINVVAYKDLGTSKTHLFRFRPGKDTNDTFYEEVALVKPPS